LFANIFPEYMTFELQRVRWNH